VIGCGLEIGSTYTSRAVRDYLRFFKNRAGFWLSRISYFGEKTHEGVKELGLDAQVSKITDVNQIASYGGFIT